jgi:hypothetical protein
VSSQRLRFGALVAGALLLTGCGGGSQNADGSAGAESSSEAPKPAVVSPDQLDAGKYPTAPRPPLGNAGLPATGVIVDAQHMADYVVGPWDVDEAAVEPYLGGTFLLNSGRALEQLGPPQIAAAADRRGMVNGFASARQAPDKLVLVNAVMRFPDAEAAKAASADMNGAAAQQQIQGKAPTPTEIPDQPDALASTYPFTPHGSGKTWAAVRSFTPHGTYVLMQVAQSVDGVEAAAKAVASTIDKQRPAIDEFTPGAIDAMADVPLDPTGLLARTVPGGPDTPMTKNAVYSLRGALHFQSNPVGSNKLFTDNGVDAVAMADANVYQAKDESAAANVADAFGVEVSTNGVEAADPVPALPDSRCLKFPAGFYCVAPAGRYAIEVQAKELPDAHQRVSAQYVMLTAHG